MDLRYSAAEERFRSEVRSWLADAVASLPPRPEPEDWAGRRAYDTGWQRMLHDAGYAGIHWAREHGGRGGTPTEQFIFLEESERAGAPRPGVNFVGLLHAGPTIGAEGTPEQQARHLPPVLRGDEVWCQGFSEPEAGSDLASLRTRAVLDGDHYVVNGQKIWTSFAQVADYCELLVRTDPDASKHRGISWLIVPMDTPGIDVRPMRTLAGSSEFSEVFFDNVRIPVANRVGAENDGWRVAMVTFSFERGTAFVGDLLRSRELLQGLARMARDGGARDDSGVRRTLGHLAAELDALWALARRSVTQAERTGGPPKSGSVFKLAYSETRNRMGDLAVDLAGRSALAPEPGSAVDEQISAWFQAISLSIAAGTSQIQRNIIGERMLGLPKELDDSTVGGAEGSVVNFEPDDGERALQEGIRALCGGRAGLERLRAAADRVDRDLWRELADNGVFSVRVAEDAGGLGLGFAASALVLEELGRALIPGPLVATMLAAAAGDGEAAAGRHLLGVVDRTSPATVEHVRDLDVLVVLDGDGARRIDPSALEVEDATPLDPLTGVGVVRELPKGDAFPAADGWRRVGAALTAALLVGVAAGATEHAVAYAKDRRQFGREIGSFQSVKHLLADMLVRTELARSAAYAAAAILDDPKAGDPEAAVSAAKLLANGAAFGNGRACVQVMGGMGFTWEMPAHLYLKRAVVLGASFGSTAEHEERLAGSFER